MLDRKNMYFAGTPPNISSNVLGVTNFITSLPPPPPPPPPQKKKKNKKKKKKNKKKKKKTKQQHETA